jgi:hypothetical protein
MDRERLIEICRKVIGIFRDPPGYDATRETSMYPIPYLCLMGIRLHMDLGIGIPLLKKKNSQNK